MGITQWPGYDVALYAQATGLFKKQGLEVEFVRFTSPPDAARALLRGALDASFMNLSVAMQADPGSDRPVFFLVADTSYGADGIVTQSGIKTVEALKGKRVSAKLGAANHLILLEALQAHNMKPDEVQIEDVPNDLAEQLMLTKQVDGAAIWQPLLSQIAEKLDGNIVHTTQDVDTLIIDGLATRSTIVQKKHEALKRFTLAWFDLMEAVEQQPQEVFEAVSDQLGQSAEAFAQDYSGLKKGDIALNKRMFPEGRLEEAAQQLKDLLQSDPRHGRVLRDDLETDAEFVVSAIEVQSP